MALTPVRCSTERFGAGGEGHVIVQDLHEAAMAYRDAVQMAVVDRPAAGKSRFQWKSGADDWLTNRNSLRLSIHHNRNDGLREYLVLLEQDLRVVRDLLCRKGSVYVFADQRTSGHVRLLLDDVFGRSNFLNEIIWAQPAGLMPAGRFTRSHQTIFLYQKGSRAFFNAGAAGRARGKLASHMKRAEEDGRAYYARQSGGREYRYYEDDIVSIGDVWADIPEITAKDDERTGWEGQRPEALLSRMIAASSAPGSIVCDAVSGSGTAASAAQRLGRRSLAAFTWPSERMLARRRLLLAGAQDLEIAGSRAQPETQPEVSAALSGGMAQLDACRRAASHPQSPGSLLDDGLGALEYWAAGRAAGGVFQANAWAMRTRQQPTLPKALQVGGGEGQPCIHLVDATGEQWFYVLD